MPVLDPAGWLGDVRTDLGLSNSAEQLLPVVAALPLASVVDYSAVVGKTPSYFYPRLSEMEFRGLLRRVSLGATKPKVARWWLTQEGINRLLVFSPHWHEEWALARLLERLPMVEWFYQAAAELPGLGELENFSWFNGVAWDAAARYREGWAAFFWSGMMQRESRVRETFTKLGVDLVRHSVLGGAPYPGYLCFVVGDAWQREIVFRVARQFGCTAVLRVWCVSDGTVAGAREPGRSTGWVHQLPVVKDMGGWGWEKRVADCYWSGPAAFGGTRLLDAVAEWPGMISKFGKALFQESGSSRWVQRLFTGLHKAGLVAREELAHGSYRYSVCQKGFNVLALRDRVSNTRLPAGVRPLPVGHRRQAHEDGVMGLMGEFGAAGVAGAAGWRCWEHMGGAGGIAPDGLVYLDHSPYGPGWHYLEYERSARGRNRVERKMQGYAAAERINDWPVLMVVWNKEAEAVFQQVGRDAGISLLTTTVDRLARCGAVRGPNCWLMYGTGVEVG